MQKPLLSILSGLAVSFLSLDSFGQNRAPVSPNVSHATTGSASAVAAARVVSDTYGTSSLSIYTLPMYLFEPYRSVDQYSWVNNGRYLTTSGGYLTTPVMLPAGASVERMDLEACDTSTSGDVYVELQTCPVPAASCNVSGFLSTGVAQAPGCNTFSTTFPPFTIDNAANMYQIWQTNTPNDGSTRFTAVRLFYRLQISPDPGTSTFADVPVGHPFHRFVEALVAAGITGGCGGGNYCPDAPITRGQMAVFLSGALGLHWAP